MNISQIIAEIDEKYPNSGVTTESKVRKMDTLQKLLYRKFKIVTSKMFGIVAGQEAYPLGINSESIIDILIDGTSYPRKQVNSYSSSSSRYWYPLPPYTGIYPTPQVDGTLTVFYYGPPETLTADDLSVSPSLDDNFHMLFVYYVCKELAENFRDESGVINGFVLQYNNLYDELAAVFNRQEVQYIRSESGW